MNKAEVILPPTPSTCSSLTSAHRNSNLRTSHHQLSAIPSNLHLFSYFAARPHAKTLAKPRIFLPHLVASLEQVDETYIMVKPDGVQRGLVGEIISRFEKKGFKLTGLKLFQCPQDLAEVRLLFKDPVTLCTGKTYDKSSIEKWLSSGNLSCPVTMQKLHDPSMVPTHTLRHFINQWPEMGNQFDPHCFVFSG